MNGTYKVQAHYAVSKAREAVQSWEKALEVQQAAGDLEGIAFCEASLRKCRANLEFIREDVRDVAKWN